MKKRALVVGASGATGRLLVEQLLIKEQSVVAIVRSPEKMPKKLIDHPNLSMIKGSILDMSDHQISDLVKDCDAVASCLGHNMTLKGLYGHPRRLVRDAVKKLCIAIESNNPEHSVKFVLMNTSGNQNRDIYEPITFGEKVVIGLIRTLVPPHADNEQAADYLSEQIGQKHSMIEWVAVRPDSLIDEESVTAYEVHPSPIRSPIFNAGKTSRINVAHFMGELISNEDVWNTWRGQMPVIYNKADLN